MFRLNHQQTNLLQFSIYLLEQQYGLIDWFVLLHEVSVLGCSRRHESLLRSMNKFRDCLQLTPIHCPCSSIPALPLSFLLFHLNLVVIFFVVFLAFCIFGLLSEFFITENFSPQIITFSGRGMQAIKCVVVGDGAVSQMLVFAIFDVNH